MVKLFVDLELPALDGALGELLPAGVKPTSVHFDGDRLRIDGKGPLGVAVAIVARVEIARGILTLSDIDFEGPAFGRGAVRTKLRKGIAGLDVQRGVFHLRGDDDGRRLVITWT